MSRRRRALVTLLVASSFPVLAGSGAVLFFWEHAHRTAAIHTTFGALVLLAVALHVRNNARALAIHAAGRPPRRPTRELAIILVPVGLLFLGMCHEIDALSALRDPADAARSRQDDRRDERRTVQHVETNAGAPGPALELDVRAGEAGVAPLRAVWIEDEHGSYIETLYLSRGVARGRPVDEVDGARGSGEVRRREALPVWARRRGRRPRDGRDLPDDASPAPDATGATPTASWHLTTRTTARHTRFTIYVEVAPPLGRTDHARGDGSSDDALDRDAGGAVRASAVHAADVDLTRAARYYALNPVGRGHRAGGDGRLDPDLATPTSADHLVDGILLEVVRP